MNAKFSTNEYIDRLRQVLLNLDGNQIDNGISLVREAWQRGSQIITLGNGGSSVTALHYITDWNKSIYLSTGKPFYGRTLVDNIGLIMAYGNDISFEEIFIEQLKNILKKDDLVIAISGSGNSQNVLRAVDYANQQGAITLGLCGYNGGALLKKAQHSLLAEINDMQLSEDIHAIFGHLVMKSLCINN